MKRSLDAGPLLALHGLADGLVEIGWSEAMSGLEADPRDDWLHVALQSLRTVAAEGVAPERAAFIGSGNGIDAIAAARIFPSLKTITVTDVLGEVLDQVVDNVAAHADGPEIIAAAGRDCEPLSQAMDLIYANLPLILVHDEAALAAVRATTTLGPASHYSHLADGDHDPIERWSLLSQLGFLCSARERLAPGGTIVTLIGGRIPDDEVAACFARAELEHRVVACGFMAQSDPEFLEQYAEEERRRAVSFEFYAYDHAVGLLHAAGLEAPGLVHGLTSAQLRALLAEARVNAALAHQRNERVGHLAFGYLARPR